MCSDTSVDGARAGPEHCRERERDGEKIGRE